MPRRNNRGDNYPPLDLTRVVVRETPSVPQQISGIPWKPRSARKTEAELRVELAEVQRQARIRNGIDWTVCLVPGCGEELHSFADGLVHRDRRDPDVVLPMCTRHAVVVWRHVRDYTNTTAVIAEREELHQRIEAQDKAIDRDWVVREQGGEGIIYMLRQNNLIKVGWSSDIVKRLKSYGPSVEILCTYPGTRADETSLHRQLRSELAKGREWYHDSPVLQLFVSNEIERHGPPRLEHMPAWTQPKAPVVSPRKRTR